MTRFQREDGKYALTAEADELGYYHLIANPDTEFEYDAGCVANPANFEAAVEAAEEEMEYLMEQAREEFGY